MSDRELPLALTVLRLVRRWNQDHLARASGIRNSSISDYERGKKVPELNTLRRLVDTMGYSLSTLDRTQRFVAALDRESSSESRAVPGEPASALPAFGDESEDMELEQALADTGRALSRLMRAIVLHRAPPPIARSADDTAADRPNES